jgi:dipeptidyl aminopeptidase/acylaminoacyl peptidase
MFRCAVVFVSLAAVLATASIADAQYFGRNKVRYDRFDFRIIQTEHFDIYYYAQEEDAARHASRMAERWYARFSNVLEHTFLHRQPLVLYASHPHFAQTNVTPAVPGEGTGGLTERNKTRIVMPFAAGLDATDHVLGHEIAHAFQIDMVRRAGRDAFSLPGWFIEGMAEYLSVGPDDSHTAMWLRDASAHRRLPTVEQLNQPRYSPYRYGQAFWTYFAGRYGDKVLARVLRSKVRDAVRRLEEVSGVGRDQLTTDWHESVSADNQDRDARVISPTRLATFARDGARLHVAPSLSPDGRYLMFMSERDRLSLDLFLANGETGALIRKMVSTATDPHFDSLQYIHSSGAWDSAGKRFAMATLSGGRPVLVIVDVSQPNDRKEIPLDDLGEIYNPSWSPDGQRIVFSALKGGLSDLFLYSFATGKVEQLTADPYADLHPAWSPDGRTIALTTDRFTSRIDDLYFGALRIGLLDIDTGVIRPLVMDQPRAKQVSPQWSPDGSGVYFISDRDGTSNVYRAEVVSGALRQVTDVPGGVTGITSTSPALAVAARAGTLAFSVYRNGRYEIETLHESAALHGPLVEVDHQPETLEPAGTLTGLLANSQFGLPAKTTFASTTYNDRLRLEAVAPPFIGAATGSGFGSALRASVGVSFADTLRDRQLQAAVRLGTDVDDLALQVAYTNGAGRWDWGVAAGIVPTRFVGARRAIARAQELITRETRHLLYTHQWAKVAAQYDLNRTQRLEFGLGVRRTGLEWQAITRVIDPAEGRTISRSLDEMRAGRPIVVAETDVAFVHDTAISGPTSPVLGQRLRIGVEPALGGLMFADVHVDARRYLMPVRPVTLAIRAEHVGRYGSDAGDKRLTPLVATLQTRVRGYSLSSFAAEECGVAATTCSPLDELTGSRLGLLNVELRAPIFGLLTGDLNYGPVPIEAIAFADAGFLWTPRSGAPAERDRFRSAGAGARINVGGFVFEATAARVFDRPDKNWTASVLLRPGF